MPTFSNSAATHHADDPRADPPTSADLDPCPSARGGVLEMVREDKPSPSRCATMKEWGGRSSEKRRPHGSTKLDGRSIIPEWASLPPELVQAIADRVLSTTGGIDAYMDMRAVCPSWRSAIAKASPLAGVTDIRFRPRNWIMVDLRSRNHDDDARLFLHTSTGRFRRLRLPVLRGQDQLVVGASDGLIILTGREDLTRVLNPLTGDMLQFPVLLNEGFGTVDKHDEVRTALSGGPNSTLVVWRNWEWMWHSVLYADPTSAEFTQEEKTGIFMITSMVSFQGNIYLAGLEGSVVQFVRPSEECDHELLIITEISPDVDIYLEGDNSASSYLVESAGELLLVRHMDQALKVFRVDVEHKLLEEVKTMGCRALFLGRERCVSVDANMLPSIEADCIYLSDWAERGEWRGLYMHVYNLRDDTMEILFSEPMLRSNIHPRRVVHVEQTPQGDLRYIHTDANIPPEQSSPRDYGFWESRGIFTRANNHSLPPLSLIQVLLDYCNDLTLTWLG